MDFIASPCLIFLTSKLKKLRCHCTSKPLGIHVYLATIKNSYFVNGKYLEANAKAIHALKSTLNDDYLSRFSNIESAFVVWNTLNSLGEQMHYHKESDSNEESATSNMCTWSKGMTPLR